MRPLASFVLRRTAWILWVSAALTVLGGIYSVKLYQNLRTDLEELLPTSSRSVRDLDQVARRLRSIDNIAILIFSKDTQASKRFVLDLARRLESFPKDEVANVEYRIDRELQFFQKRSALYTELGDLVRIRDFVQSKLSYERRIRNPLNIFSGEDIPEPELDFRSLRKKYESRARDYTRFPDGFFATPDETERVILIDVPGKTLGIDRIKRLKERVVQAIDRLKPSSYAQDLEIHYTGSVVEMLEEQDALVEDLVISTVVVLVLVTAAMLAFFQSFWATAALVASILAGTLWTFGVSYFAVGFLNANSAFLGSIVLGNGINFGIIFLARYMEERRRGRDDLRASHMALSLTSKATLTAALAAGLSYGSLMLTSFRGFRQFGVIGLIGMILCWLSAYALLPALLTLCDRLGLLRVRAAHASGRKTFFTAFLAQAISRWPRWIATISTLFTLIALALMTRAGTGLLETNLEKLRSKKSVDTGAAHYSQYLAEIFQRFLTPMVVLPSSRIHALQIAERLKDLKHEQGPGSPIVSVQTIDDFVPKDQARKIAVLREIQSFLKPQIMVRLSREEKSRVDALLTPEAFHSFAVEDLPPLVRDKFREKDGSLGKLVLVEPPLSKDIWEGGRLGKFVEGLRYVADSIEAGAPVAGGMAISSDLMASISRDGPRATLLAFLSVMILVIVLFRDLKTVSLSLFALLIGVSWFGGLVVALADHGFKINFLNFVALPITFGIGVDYGVNVFQRYRQSPKTPIALVIRETGGAVALCSLTTVIGYSSLLMASNQGFVSFGLLAVLGEVTCVSAALIALPGTLAVRFNSDAKDAYNAPHHAQRPQKAEF